MGTNTILQGNFTQILDEILKHSIDEGLQYLLKISPTEFEHFIEFVFQYAGYRVEYIAQQHYPIGEGFDLKLYSQVTDDVIGYIEVRKRQVENKIDLPEVTSFIGKLTLVPINAQSFLITTSDFTGPAYNAEVAHDNLHGRKIRLINGKHLLRYIRFVMGTREPTKHIAVEPISPNILYDAEAILRVPATETMILAVANNKGGVGKTTSVLNCGAYLATCPNQHVLLVDFDGQNSLSYLLPDPSYEIHPQISTPMDQVTLLDYLRGEKTLAEVVRKTYLPQIELLPSSPNMRIWERDNGQNLQAELRFIADLHALAKTNGYQWIIIDTPPGQGFFARAALATAHYGIIPILAEVLGINPIAGTVATGRTMSALVNEKNPFVGGFFTHWKATKVSKQTQKTINEYFRSIKMQAFNQTIPVDAQIEQSHQDIISGKKSTLFNHNSPAATAYKSLVKELLSYVQHPHINLA
jgi:chromosome partitioning protein